MAHHNPPHPGEFLQELYLEPGNISIRKLAGRLQVSASTLQRLIGCQSRLTPDMALRLSRVVGRSAESWLALQDHHEKQPPCSPAEAGLQFAFGADRVGGGYGA